MKAFLILFLISFQAFSQPLKNTCPQSMELDLKLSNGAAKAKLLRTTAVYGGITRTYRGEVENWQCEYQASGKLPDQDSLTSATLLTGQPYPQLFSGLVLATANKKQFSIKLIEPLLLSAGAGAEVFEQNADFEVSSATFKVFSDLRGVTRHDDGLPTRLSISMTNLKKDGSCYYKRQSNLPDYLEILFAGKDAISLMASMPMSEHFNAKTSAYEKWDEFKICVRNSRQTYCSWNVRLPSLQVENYQNFVDSFSNHCFLAVDFAPSKAVLNNSKVIFDGALANILGSWNIRGCTRYPGDPAGKSAQCDFNIP